MRYGIVVIGELFGRVFVFFEILRAFKSDILVEDVDVRVAVESAVLVPHAKHTGNLFYRLSCAPAAPAQIYNWPQALVFLFFFELLAGSK